MLGSQLCPDDVIHYIGHKWKLGANGPNTWDCVTFTNHVLKKFYSRQIVDEPSNDIRKYIRIIKKDGYKKVSNPKDGCVCVFRDPAHIGIWLNLDGGGVLQCTEEAGVIFVKKHTPYYATMGKINFYEYVGTV